MWAQDTSKVVVVHAIYKRTRALPLHRWLHPSVSVSRGTDRSAGKLRIATPNSRHICTCRALLSRGLARTSSRSRRCSQRHAFSGATVLFTSSTLYTLSLFALMLFAPRRRSTVGLMQSDWIFVPLSAMYITLLLQSWTPDTLQLIMPGSLQAGLSGKFSPQFFPKLQGIQQLFAQVITAASLWVHLLSVNLFAARHAYLQGLCDQSPVQHSIFLSMFFGPFGMLSHFLTQVFTTPRGGTAPAQAQPSPS